jgi:hypothetical protein
MVLALIGTLFVCWPTPPPQAQGYSGAAPNVSAAAGVSLRAVYTAGTITSGGATQAITADAVGLLTTDTQTSCAAPAYTACNFIYWPGSGVSLATTTTYSTAFAPGNVVVAFVTTNAGDITLVTPAAWNLPTSAASISGFTGTTSSYWVPPSACDGSVSANPDTANHTYTVIGTSLHPVFNLAVDATAATHSFTFVCNITPPSNLTTGRGVQLTAANFFYGVQTTAPDATQLTVAASGTYNSQIVFTKVAYPAAGAGETSSTEAPVRADAGNLVYTPTGATFNNTVTTAGRFYTQTFTPATPFGLETPLTQYYLNVKIINPTTQATIINTPGVQVVYTVVR